MNTENEMELNYCYHCMKALPAGVTICPDCGNDNTKKINPEDILREGTILSGKYMVGHKLGRGGFGVTYIGIDLFLGVKVAIKEYFPVGVGIRAADSLHVTSSSTLSDANGYEKGCEEFQSEAKTLARFNSPNIVRVREYFRENGTAYIVMDYIGGDTLSNVARKNGGKLPWERVVSLFKPLILELDDFHKQNIIHRDIKPDNLKITTNKDGDEHLVLLDFGAARSFVSAEVTKTYTALVSPGYAPIEQYSSNSRQGPYTDVYALCATMYALISGVIPAIATDRVMGESVLEPFNAMGLDVPKNIEKAILHGLAAKASDRPQTMRQFYDELTAGPGSVKGKTKKNKPSKIWISAAALIILLAGAYFLIRSIRQKDTETDATHPVIALQGSEELPSDAEKTQTVQAQILRNAQETVSAQSTNTQEVIIAEQTAAALKETETAIVIEMTNEMAWNYTQAALEASQTEMALTQIAMNIMQSTYESLQAQQADIAGSEQEDPPSPADGHPPVPTYTLVPTETARPTLTPTAVPTQTPLPPTPTPPAWMKERNPVKTGSISAKDANRRGNDYMKQNNYEEAVRWFYYAADAGFASAQINLGTRYFYGQGIGKNYEEAVKWYRKASDQGDPAGSYYLGMRYFHGEGIEKNESEAASLFLKAASKNYTNAYYWLAECYYNGKGVNKNDTEAVKWYKKAADNKNNDAQYMMGYAYENGLGNLKKDITEAAHWYNRAAQNGNTKAGEKFAEIQNTTIKMTVLMKLKPAKSNDYTMFTVNSGTAITLLGENKLAEGVTWTYIRVNGYDGWVPSSTIVSGY